MTHIEAKANTKTLTPAPAGRVKDDLPILLAILKRYKTSALIKMDVSKKVKSEFLIKEQIHQGKIFISYGKMRWENDKPEKTLLIFDGKTVWNVQYPDKGMNTPIQVAKSNFSKSNNSSILMDYLSGKNIIDKNFKLLKSEKQNQKIQYFLEAKNKKANIKSMQIAIDLAMNSISEVEYKDEIGNTTHLQFSTIDFLKNKNDELFKFKIPKGAQVTSI
ncbi:MAG: LolA family protein [Pseudobdellovibrionaceae bacterium]